MLSGDRFAIDRKVLGTGADAGSTATVVVLMAEPEDNDAFRSYWLAYPVTLYFGEHPGDGSKIAIEARVGG